MNLFLEAIGSEKISAINETKENKRFLLSLIEDLDKVFHTHYEISDKEDCVEIRIKPNKSYGYHGTYSFFASKNGVRFSARVLGYYECKDPNFKPIGKLYEKYKDFAATADKSFLKKDSIGGAHGYVEFNIPLYRSDLIISMKDTHSEKQKPNERLVDTLKDIVYLLEKERYNKRF